MEERLYDLIFICLPTTPEEEIAKIIGTLEQAAAGRGGSSALAAGRARPRPQAQVRAPAKLNRLLRPADSGAGQAEKRNAKESYERSTFSNTPAAVRPASRRRARGPSGRRARRRSRRAAPRQAAGFPEEEGLLLLRRKSGFH